MLSKYTKAEEKFRERTEALRIDNPREGDETGLAPLVNLSHLVLDCLVSFHDS